MALLDINSLKKGHLSPIIKILYIVIAILFVATYGVNEYFHKESQMIDKRIKVLDYQAALIRTVTLDNFSEESSAAPKFLSTIKALSEGDRTIQLQVAIVEDLAPETDKYNEQIIRDIDNKWDFFTRAYHYYDPRVLDRKKQVNLDRILNEISRLQGGYFSNLKKQKKLISVRKNAWISILGVFLIITFGIVYYLQNVIKKGISNVNLLLEMMAHGQLSSLRKEGSIKDFETTYKSLREVSDKQKEISTALEKIGEGDFSIELNSRENDLLGESVLTMKDKLHKFFEEDKRKTHISSWTNKGLALFGEIMRNTTESLDMLAGEINQKLVKYMEANQGAIYILEKHEEKGDILQLVSAYAWERKKFLEKEIEVGEGIIGQVLLEKETTYLTDVPNNFVNITSGLGEANPRSILIVPIKVNDDIYGVIEIASFKIFESYEIELVEKVGESIASVIGNIRTNEETKVLLRDSQLLTEQLRTQEEELLQNTEELQATQENINQKLEIIDFQRQKNEAILEASADGLITFNQNGQIELFNKAAEDIWQTSRDEVIGQSITKLMPLQIDLSVEGSAVYFAQDEQKIALDVRTEVSVDDSFGNEVPVLITISKSKIGDEMYFALFVQSIAVELF
ncbi:MAG: GAF domain-containing protein [Cytophagales bacterium]|nr:GAF domain-containing protein [Cytophagales bacterium]